MKGSGFFKFLAIGGIIIGGFGCFNGFFGTVAALTPGFNQLGSKFLDQLAQSPELKEEMERNMQFQKEVEALMDEWKPYTLPSAIYGLGASLFLLLSSIGLTKLKPRAPLHFKWACLASIPKVVGATTINLLLQRETLQLTNQWIQSLFVGREGAPVDFVGGIMRFTQMAGAVFTVLVALLALAYYISGIVYMDRPKVQDLFRANRPEAPDQAQHSPS